MTRILTSIISYYNTSLLVNAVISSLVTNSLVTVYLSPVWVLAQWCTITLAFSLRVTVPNIYIALAQYPLMLSNQDLHTPESQPPVAPQHRPSPWTLPGLIQDRCHEPCHSIIPQHWLTKAHTLTSESGPSVTPTPAQFKLLLPGVCHKGEARAASPDGSLHQS